jgi:hypothetical protein
MLSKLITRRLMVVPLANNDHGKTTMIRSLVRQGGRYNLDKVKRSSRWLTSPWGRSIDALVIPRSYQETLANEFGSVKAALDGVDSSWSTRDLIIFPSHLVVGDCNSIIALAHGAGFDAIVVPILLQPSELPQYRDCLSLAWDERWTLLNEQAEDSLGQIEALGHDLWVWVASALERR